VKALSKKEKLLAAAQKNLLKGQIGKAIKDYEKIVEGDAKDIRNRQKLAELYSRDRMPEKALETYEGVAKHYVDNGFFLKALAVYKQMQKVDASRPELYQRLAELNIKQGLVGNALTEYRNLLNLYRQQGDLEAAVKVLGQMQDLDPNNLGISLQMAEAYSQTHQVERAAESLVETLQRFIPNANLGAMEKIQEVGLACCPTSVPLKVELAEGFLACGQAGRSVDLLQEVLTGDPQHCQALLLLANSYHAQADHASEISTYAQLVEMDAGNLDWRKGYAWALLTDEQAEQALAELEQFKEGFFAEGRAADLKDIYELVTEQLPDNEQAVASLQAIYEQTGEGGKLFDLMSSQRDAEPIAEKVVAEEPVTDATASPADPTSFDDLDLDLDLDDEPSSPSGDNDPMSTFEIEVDREPEQEMPQGSGLEFDDLDLDGIEFGLDTGSADEAAAADDAPLDTDVNEPPAHPAVDVSGEVEEAEFYFQQGLLAEASKKCQSLLDRVGACPQVEQLLEKIAKTGGAPAADDQGQITPGMAAGGGGAVLKNLEDRERSRLDGSLSDFRKGLESQVSSEDFETHYNLGIAYKEMGLLDDAIDQFDKVVSDPQRRIDCLTLKGVCLVQKGAFDQAVSTFKEGLAYEALKDGERISLYYELGLLYVAWGQPLEALDSFQCVADVDPFFRNVDEQIRQLRKELGLDDDNGGSPSGNGSDKSRVSYI
jgi:tetratricopeptide (TPR) repeat protein